MSTVHPTTLARAASAINWVSQLGLALSALLLGLLVLTQAFEAVVRALGAPTTWVFDFNLTVILGVVFLALAGAQRHGEHINADFLIANVPRRLTRHLSVAIDATTLLLLGMLVWFGLGVVWESAQQGRTTGGLVPIPAALPQLLLPIGATLLALQTVVTSIERFVEVDGE